jgi:hypothetical protein
MDETGRELKSCKMWPIIRKCYVVFIWEKNEENYKNPQSGEAVTLPRSEPGTPWMQT